MPHQPPAWSSQGSGGSTAPVLAREEAVISAAEREARDQFPVHLLAAGAGGVTGEILPFTPMYRRDLRRIAETRWSGVRDSRDGEVGSRISGM